MAPTRFRWLLWLGPFFPENRDLRIGGNFVIPIDIDWNDIGSWQAVYDLMPKDENGNCFTGNIINHNSKNNYILSENKKKTIALAGVENLIIVDTKEALLICKKEKPQDVKKIVEILTLKKQDE